MSLKDFKDKKKREIEKHGVVEAARSGAMEGIMKGVLPFTKPLETPIWDEDWDVCLVLDATRLDLWRDVAAEYDDGGSAWSVGSASPEWIAKTFADEHERHWRDAAYVTGNPFSGRRPEEENSRWIKKPVYPLKERGLGYLDEVWQDAWNEGSDLETLDPAMLTDRAMWAYHEHGRVIVHYMQPHAPFRSNPEWFEGWGGMDDFGNIQRQDDIDIWMKLRDGKFDEGEFMEAYADNLRWVLEEVERWRTETGADILITSDHGNAKGEWGQWSHPPGSANPVLRRVPWCKVKGVGDGPDVERPDNCPNVGASSNNDVEDRLRHLGYK